MRKPSPLLSLQLSFPDEGRTWLTWLVRLRWLAVFAQAVTLAFVFHLLDGLGPIAVWVGTMLLLVAANLGSIGRLALRDEVPPGTILTHLLVDVAALTTFFFIGDGPANPFTPLYLIHVAMGAVMLPSRLAAILAGTVLAAYSLLFVHSLPLRYENHSLPAETLVGLGRWLSFVITSMSVSAFVVGLSGTMRRGREQLLQAWDRTARTDRLRSVGTLAAGAAHELNTPLSTMALRLRRLRRRHSDPDTEADVDAIEDQLDRCASIVDRLLVGAGDPTASDIERRPIARMVAEAVRMWAKGSPVNVRIDDRSNGVEVELPDVAFEQALINLLENAREAQEANGAQAPLDLSIFSEAGAVVVELADSGVGLPENAQQMGEPFFTTKATGTGLGVFVARAVADGAGGGLQFRPREGTGAVARWWFPEARRRSP
jgi:two-component system, sensor histidine kinase RegB